MAFIVSTGEDDNHAVTAHAEMSAGPCEAPCLQDPDALSLRDLVQLGRKSIDRALGRQAAKASPVLQDSSETAATVVAAVAKEATSASANTVETADTSVLPELVDDWWSRTCKAVHNAHIPEEDAPELPHQANDCCGCLEVELLAIKDEPPLVREDGTGALDPVCQMSLQGHRSGAIRTKGTCAAAHTVRLGLRELAGADLQIGFRCWACTVQAWHGGRGILWWHVRASGCGHQAWFHKAKLDAWPLGKDVRGRAGVGTAPTGPVAGPVQVGACCNLGHATAVEEPRPHHVACLAAPV